MKLTVFGKKWAKTPPTVVKVNPKVKRVIVKGKLVEEHTRNDTRVRQAGNISHTTYKTLPNGVQVRVTRKK